MENKHAVCIVLLIPSNTAPNENGEREGKEKGKREGNKRGKRNDRGPGKDNNMNDRIETKMCAGSVIDKPSST